MNNYGAEKNMAEYKTQSECEKRAAIEQTGVCHELYIWRNATMLQTNTFQAVLRLFMFAVKDCCIFSLNPKQENTKKTW